MNPETRPVGASLLALMICLVGLLGLMLSGSLVLRFDLEQSLRGQGALAIGLFVFGLTYLVLAFGIWTMRSWTRKFAMTLLLVMTIAGLMDATGNEMMHLSTVLVFGLAFVSNLAVVLALYTTRDN